MHKKLKLLFYSTIIITLGIGIIVLNIILAENDLLFYSTGINEKAFLNSTWKMSPSEIERANNIRLSKSDMPLLFMPEVTDQSRFTARVQNDVFMWGHRVKVEYTFFDNMLFEYYIPLTAYDKKRPHEEILQTLEVDSEKKKK